jgi:beta-glucosidase
MSRSDWQGTYPVAPTVVEATDDMIRVLNGNLYEKPEDAPSAESFTQGDFQEITLASMHGVPIDDPLWDTFLDQMTVTALASVLPDNNGSEAVRVIGKPQTQLGDGPDGIGGVFNAYDSRKFGFSAEATCYVNQNMLASTWNKELVERRGYFMGEEALFLGLFQLWAPGANLLRTPFGGRNFEYYSECATMSYLCVIPYVTALESKGIAAGAKHAALNDQENNRIGVAVFFNEQSLREQGLKPFEGTIAVAESRGIMQSFNRFGLGASMSSYALNTQVIRNEWGLEGFITTDACASATQGYRSTYIDQLVAGTDSFCIDFSGASAKVIANHIKNEDDGFLLGELRRAAKNILYVSVNSPAMNGLSADSTVISITPWWVPVLSTAITVSAALTGLCLLMLTLSLTLSRKKIKTETR